MILGGLGKILGGPWGSWHLGRILGGLEGILESLFWKGFGRRVAVLLVGCEGNAACSSGCILSVSSHPVSPLLFIIELSSRPVALKSVCRD